jgi:hypothetical protein
MTYLEIKSGFGSLKNYVIENEDTPIYEVVNSFASSEDNLIKSSFDEFTYLRSQFKLNKNKEISFDEMFVSFAEPKIIDLSDFWSNWDEDDFVELEALGLKESLSIYFENINDDKDLSVCKVREYMVAIFNILNRYRNIVKGETTNKEQALIDYRKKFVEVMKQVEETFVGGCEFNQLTHLKTVLSEVVSFHPMIIANVRADLSPIDFLFALALNNYQIALVDEKIYEFANSPNVNNFFHKNRKDFCYEGVELEFVVLRNLGMVSNEISAHIFEEGYSNEIDYIFECFNEDYKPLDGFLNGLTSRFPVNCFRKFHTDILKWYKERGLDPDESLENRNLLFDSRSEHDPENGVYDYWFNEKAILYFFAKNNLVCSSS